MRGGGYSRRSPTGGGLDRKPGHLASPDESRILEGGQTPIHEGEEFVFRESPAIVAILAPARELVAVVNRHRYGVEQAPPRPLDRAEGIGRIKGVLANLAHLVIADCLTPPLLLLPVLPLRGEQGFQVLDHLRGGRLTGGKQSGLLRVEGESGIKLTDILPGGGQPLPHLAGVLNGVDHFLTLLEGHPASVGTNHPNGGREEVNGGIAIVPRRKEDIPQTGIPFSVVIDPRKAGQHGDDLTPPEGESGFVPHNAIHDQRIEKGERFRILEGDIGFPHNTQNPPVIAPGDTILPLDLLVLPPEGGIQRLLADCPAVKTGQEHRFGGIRGVVAVRIEDLAHAHPGGLVRIHGLYEAIFQD